MTHWPQLGVGAIVCHQERLLLVLRGKAPGKGQWAIPGGKVRAGEPLHRAVEREILEETGVAIRAGELAWQFEFIDRDAAGALQYHYVVLDFFAEYLHGEPRAGDDAAEARWLSFEALDSLPLHAATREALEQLYPERFCLR